MARFFDPQQPEDEKLLHSSIRSHEELESVALMTEREIIDLYRERDPVTDVLEVKLTDFDPDPALADARLALVLKEVIANVVSHRLRFYDHFRQVQSETLGSYSVTYAGEASVDPRWPPGWDAPLSLWEERTPAWFV